MIIPGISIPHIDSGSKKINLSEKDNSLLIPNSISGAIIGSNQIGVLSQTKSLNVMLTLPFNNQSELSTFLSSIQNKHSIFYHKFLTAREFNKLFSPSSVEYSKYVDYFQKSGFSVKSYSDRVSIGLKGTASLFDSTFDTELVKFHSKNETYFAPDSQLQLSVNYGAISSIVGLNNMIRPSISPMFSGSNSSEVLYGSDLQQAYQLKQLYGQYGYPTNETIATILWSGQDSSGNSVAPLFKFPLSPEDAITVMPLAAASSSYSIHVVSFVSLVPHELEIATTFDNALSTVEL